MIKLNEITPIPGPINILVGYCANCGKSIYENDCVLITNMANGTGIKVYRCISCKQEVNENELIPF